MTCFYSCRRCELCRLHADFFSKSRVEKHQHVHFLVPCYQFRLLSLCSFNFIGSASFRYVTQVMVVRFIRAPCFELHAFVLYVASKPLTAMASQH